MSADENKRRAAAEAVKLVDPEMTLGLGTGSTAAHFIDLLGERVRDGLYVRGIPTSRETAQRALKAGIPLIEPDETTIIDLAVDGTDEADGHLNLIKGGGGALLREKIIASSAKRFVVIADESKRVDTLGAFPLPVEIDTFSWALSVQRLRSALADLGYPNAPVTLRPSDDGVFMSDGGHFIVDCQLGRIANAAALDTALQAIPGIVETGLFVGVVERIIFAGASGIDTITR